MIVCLCPSPAVDVTYRVPELAAGTTVRVCDVTRRAGGKGVNVARVLHRLGEPAIVLAPVGGSTGAGFAAELAAEGIEVELVPDGRPMRQTVAVVDDAGTATMLVEPAQTDCWAAVAARAAHLIRRADAVVLSGSMPIGAPPDAAAQIVAIAHRYDKPVVVDTSESALLSALSAGPTMVKPNAVELAHLVPVRDAVQAARQLARDHGTTVVASLGAEGVVAATPHEAWLGRPARGLVGNPTGAGDALVAGLARGLVRNTALPDLLPDCIALSAAAVLAPRAGEVDPAEVGRQRVGVTIEPLPAPS